MESIKTPTEMLHYINQPAFLVEGDVVIEANDAAIKRMVRPGVTIRELITVGFEEYSALKTGRLYLELTIGRAWVSAINGARLFFVDSISNSSELRTLALAAQNFRVPLTSAFSGTDSLLDDDSIKENPQVRKLLGQVNRSLYQLMRMVNNMSDAAPTYNIGSHNFRYENVTALFQEIFEKASTYLDAGNRTIEYHGLTAPLELRVDSQKLQRAVLNIISNAVKFSSPDSKIKAVLKHNDNRLTLTVENRISSPELEIYRNAFNRFLREPGIESTQYGIGLGLTIVGNTAAAHGGTLLLDLPSKQRVKVAFTIPTNYDALPILMESVQIPIGYTGGYDNCLIELSDLLPSNLYELS